MTAPDVVDFVAKANARGPTSGLTDVSDDAHEFPPGFDTASAAIFKPLKFGDLTLNHRVVHAALGRARSANATESSLAGTYFEQRTTPGALMISQATGVSLESLAWPWAVGLDTVAQKKALAHTILSGNGFLIDQFLHDNINPREDLYGGNIENRSLFTFEVVDAVAKLFGYQRIGVRLSPFSNGSQPFEQSLHLVQQLAKSGVAYLHIDEARVSQNLGIKENLDRLIAKGISTEQISLRPFRALDETKPSDPGFTLPVLIGGGGYTAVTGVLTVQEGRADVVSYGRRFISNPDLVQRLRLGQALTPYNCSTFYTHGAQGYTTYSNHDPDTAGPAATGINATVIDDQHSIESTSIYPEGRNKEVLKRVAIVGAGVSGILTTSASQRVGGFEVTIYERREKPGGVWIYDAKPTSVPKFPGADPQLVNPPLQRPSEIFSVSLPRSQQQRFTSSPMYKFLEANIPYNAMSGQTSISLQAADHGLHPYLTGAEIEKSVTRAESALDHFMEYNITIEDVDGSDKWYEEEFQHLVVAAGHNSVPRVPDIPGLQTWKAGCSIRQPGGQEKTCLAERSWWWALARAQSTWFYSRFPTSRVTCHRVRGLYQHIFDIYNPGEIAFVGVVNLSLTWLTWEKSAFLVALLWSGRIKLPPREVQQEWEAARLADKDERLFHVLEHPHERVLFFDELNELAAAYLQDQKADDELLRGFPFEWVIDLLAARQWKLNKFSNNI
ncbi:hypothetical protein ACJZ2D_004545 [Fusarium nematophilum]